MSIKDQDYTISDDVYGDCTITTRYTPHKCPVCKGRGAVHYGFYEEFPHQEYTSSGLVSTTQCRSCSGTGVVWS